MVAIDLTGRRFGRLTVIAYDGHIGLSRAWSCACDCGGKARISGAVLSRGGASSCGCLRRERVTTHGLSTSAEYGIWKAARGRCHDPRAQSYRNYGARGITMCERWRTRFEDFYADMGVRPSAFHSLDRIDNDGPYSPENCRWATMVEQRRNMRRNHQITAFGQTHTLAEWSKRRGISDGTIRARLALGWAIEDALTLRPDRSRSYVARV